MRRARARTRWRGGVAGVSQRKRRRRRSLPPAQPIAVMIRSSTCPWRFPPPALRLLAAAGQVESHLGLLRVAVFRLDLAQRRGRLVDLRASLACAAAASRDQLSAHFPDRPYWRARCRRSSRRWRELGDRRHFTWLAGLRLASAFSCAGWRGNQFEPVRLLLGPSRLTVRTFHFLDSIIGSAQLRLIDTTLNAEGYPRAGRGGLSAPAAKLAQQLRHAVPVFRLGGSLRCTCSKVPDSTARDRTHHRAVAGCRSVPCRRTSRRAQAAVVEHWYRCRRRSVRHVQRLDGFRSTAASFFGLIHAHATLPRRASPADQRMPLSSASVRSPRATMRLTPMPWQPIAGCTTPCRLALCPCPLPAQHAWPASPLRNTCGPSANTWPEPRCLRRAGPSTPPCRRRSVARRPPLPRMSWRFSRFRQVAAPVDAPAMEAGH